MLDHVIARHHTRENRTELRSWERNQELNRKRNKVLELLGCNKIEDKVLDSPEDENQ